MDRKKFVFDFLQKNHLGVISTVGKNNQPESALIGVGQTEDLEIIFGTDESTRKFKNLQGNSAVSFVIGFENAQTLQYEGVAREISGDEREKYTEIYYEKNPFARQFHSQPGERNFLVTPKWIRFTDYSAKPSAIWEMNF